MRKQLEQISVVVSACLTAWTTLWISTQDDAPFILRMICGMVGLFCFAQAIYGYQQLFNR